ncbi:sphingolipid long chain base-responsive protein pil1 [Moniliophthora roreri]|uniref:Sphingolipid long chain base-responsive protein pil1 n=1 Tax=Moniliophthora roreri TaxID=221103 RepID=A0A0W0G2I1_MONRR|nr:sphingolipid long chain base-responsive protein pil1 [Moniliophthora roreri]
MPVPGFLSSIADKAQTALQSSPLGQHIPGHGRPTSPDTAAQPSANEAAQGGWGGQHKSHAFEAIQHQIRSLGQQYGSTTPVQKIITTEKGVAIDFDSVARDAKAQSKELYMWGQNEQDDLKDVTDRLAYLNFVQGSLASSLAVKLDAARAPLKALRDAEAALAPRRNIRAGFKSQIARIEHDQQKGMEKKLAELRDQLRKAELDDASAEAEVELLKRQGVKASESLKFEALREYGEKLVLVSQAAASLVDVLPIVPPSQSNPYTGAQRTGSIRASLQRALDNYKTGHINLPTQSNASDLSRSDTVSFGESHASELSSISSSMSTAIQPSIPLTPPPGGRPQSPPRNPADSATSADQHASPPAKTQSLPINPSNLNLSPAPIPHTTSNTSGNIPGASVSITSPVPVAAPDPTKPASVLPAITPTIAETGVPVSAGSDGPGPASGSLHDVKTTSPTGPQTGSLLAHASTQSAPKFESAEDEKKRLAAMYSQAYGSSAPAASQHESAEDEKKRLEREEREKHLNAGGNNPSGDTTKKDKDEDLPPYQDL